MEFVRTMYSYEDFVKAATAAGKIGNFSQYDLDLARKYPEFGLSILSLKQDWDSATTAEQRALANTAANELRTRYGKYTGGTDGAKYYAQGSQGIASGQSGGFNYVPSPEFTDTWKDTSDTLLSELLNREPFSWDKDSDPNYGAYKKEYLREGERATANAIAQSAGMTGGMPSTAAITAATQAGDYYATQLSDMIPTLYQQAYERYLDEYSMKQSDLSAVNSQRDREHNYFTGAYDRWADGRDFAYGQYTDKQAGEATTRDEARGEVDAILAAGGTPSAELAALAGYTNEYIQSLRAYYAQQNAPRAAGGSGNTAGGAVSGGGKVIEADVKAQVDGKYPDGVITDADDWAYLAELYGEDVLTANGYSYNGLSSDFKRATGQYRNEDTGTLFSEEELKEFAWKVGMNRSKNGMQQTIKDALDEGKITEAQARALLDKFGIVY